MTRRRIGAYAAALALAAPVAVAGRAAVAAELASEQSERPDSGGADGRRTLRRLPVNLGRGIIGVFHRDTIIPLVIGVVATGGASALDKDVRDHIQQGASPGQGWGQSLETAAGPVWSTVFVAGVFTAGRIAHASRFRAATYDMLDAAVVNTGYTEIFKAAFGRERPNGEDNKSFPSGHTSNAFALATVAERHYGWKIGAPAYLLAGVVGASRMQQDKHYLSDVVAGATLGCVVGRAVVRMNNRPLPDGSRQGAMLNVAPLVARHARGLQMSLTF